MYTRTALLLSVKHRYVAPLHFLLFWCQLVFVFCFVLVKVHFPEQLIPFFFSSFSAFYFDFFSLTSFGFTVFHAYVVKYSEFQLNRVATPTIFLFLVCACTFYLFATLLFFSVCHIMG